MKKVSAGTKKEQGKSWFPELSDKGNYRHTQNYNFWYIMNTRLTK